MALSPLDRRSFFKVSGLALGGAAVLAACGDDSSTATPATSSSPGGPVDFGTLVIQLSWIKNVEFAGEYFADTRGYFREAGFSGINLMAGGAAGTAAEAALITGRAFAGLSSPVLTAPAIVEGAPLKIVGATFQKNPFCILSKSDNPIPDAQAMRGKRIGVQDANDLVWTALLAANGIDEGDIERVPVQFDPSPVTNGEVDGFLAYVTNEPNSLRVRGEDVTTFLFADNGFPLFGETIAVTQESIDSQRDKVKALLTAEIRGWKDAITEIDEAVRLATQVYGKDLMLDAAEQKLEMSSQVELITSPDTESGGLFIMTPELIAQNIESLQRASIDITPEQLFDTTLLEEVYAENPDLK